MAQNQIEGELEKCHKYYRDFKNIKWLMELLYNFRQDKIAKADNLKLHNPIQKSADFVELEHHWSKTTYKPHNIEIPLTELIPLIKEIANQIKVEQKNQQLVQDIKDWSLDLETVLSYYCERVKLIDIGELINEVAQQFPTKRDFTNLLLIFSLSTLLELRGNRNFIADLSTAEPQTSHCPICFNKPHYGLLRSEDGKKMLECWLCGIQWEFPRLKCPYCENENQNQLGFFTLAADDLCRVQFCKICFSYHKVFDLRKSGPIALLEMHNFASLTHDFNAEMEGFQPGSGLHWVNEGELINT